MTEPATIEWRDDFVIKLLDKMGDDRSILRAMLVASDLDDPSQWEDQFSEPNVRRLNALMRDRHGTPFEHAALQFYVEAPIFVFREWHRHRIGVSINEQSGRYSELPPQFYLPPRHRPLVKVPGSKQMEYSVEDASDEQYARKIEGDKRVMEAAYREYERQLEDGIVKESARNCLPVSIYSKMYWTCNPRSLMAFLSLRVREEAYWREVGELDLANGLMSPDLYQPEPGGSVFPSKPAWEIDACARAMEQLFAEAFPITHAAFASKGRVGP